MSYLVSFLRRSYLVVSLFAALPAIAAETRPAGESMSFLDNGVVRLGIDLSRGGSITYLADAKTRANLVNNHDLGRQIQMSHYSGPTPFIAGDKKPHPAWTQLGWNPIQSGDVAGNRSRVLAHRNDGKSLYVKCVPMQWPLDNVPGECTFECWIQLEKNTAEVRCRMNNARTDKTQYPARMQELPAVYTNGPYWRLVTYRGERPFTQDRLGTIPAKMPWSQWPATENWAALVRDDDWGLGIFAPDTYRFTGGFAGKPGQGGEHDGPTGYIAPLHHEILDHNICHEYSYVLIVGRVEEIRRYARDHRSRNALPQWRFEKDRQHWHYVHATDTGWPLQGCLDVRLDAHPQLVGPEGCWQAKDAPRLLIEAAFHTRRKEAVVYWADFESRTFTAERHLRFPIEGDGRFRVHEVNLASSPHYTGTITRVRLDPPGGALGDRVRIRSIELRGTRP